MLQTCYKISVVSTEHSNNVRCPQGYMHANLIPRSDQSRCTISSQHALLAHNPWNWFIKMCQNLAHVLLGLWSNHSMCARVWYNVACKPLVHSTVCSLRLPCKNKIHLKWNPVKTLYTCLQSVPTSPILPRIFSVLTVKEMKICLWCYCKPILKILPPCKFQILLDFHFKKLLVVVSVILE